VPLTVEQILSWADAHFRRAGRWPSAASGPVPESPGRTWAAVNAALGYGSHGLPGGDSLSRLLGRERGARPRRRPALRAGQLAGWARSHRRRTGFWPTIRSGAVFDAPGENWGKIDLALRCGIRGLPGGDSLAGLVDRLAPAPRGSVCRSTSVSCCHMPSSPDCGFSACDCTRAPNTLEEFEDKRPRQRTPLKVVSEGSPP
jgi:hypothetical protein